VIISCIDRTLTAECNNLEHPYWGASNTPFARWLPAQYENGISTPTGWEANKKYNGYTLPMVRKVSNDVMNISNTHVTGDE